MHIGKAVADQSHVTIPKGPEEVHIPKMKQIMHERKKKLSTSSPRVSEIVTSRTGVRFIFFIFYW